MPDKFRNIKLIIEYDGTDYAGWQIQKNALSVQEVLENALYSITNQRIALTAAGRTDSGVHAKGQVANFYTESAIPADRFSYALNALLPNDVRVLDSREVPREFHARFSATGKRYRYSIVSHPQGIAISRQYYHHVPFPLDIEAMIKASGYFEGTHDFYGFMSTGSRVKNTVRNLDKIRLDWQPPFLCIDLSGGGFLYNMVRIIVGTLLEVGAGRISPNDLPLIISSRDRNLAGPTAPAHGLCLMEVYY
jgi:tRNA pseudouridine38-40 synthase